MTEKPQGLNKASKKDLAHLKVLEVSQKQKDDRKIFDKQIQEAWKAMKM